MIRAYVNGKKLFQYRYLAMLINPLIQKAPHMWFGRHRGCVSFVEPPSVGDVVVVNYEITI